MENPQIILLDEPFNALDEGGIQLVREILLQRKNAGSLPVVVCHDSEELESFADEIFYLRSGKIVEHRCLNHAESGA